MRPSAADRAPGEDAEDRGGGEVATRILFTATLFRPLCSPSYVCVEVGVGSARPAGSFGFGKMQISPSGKGVGEAM